MTEAQYRIGVVAEKAGVSTRTLRYYEELGLVQPSGYSSGGSRRYAEADLHRVLRIRELQAIMGFNLEEIGSILGTEDRLAELGSEFRSGASDKRRAAIVLEAADLNARTLEKVLAKIAILEAYQAELEAKTPRHQELAEELGITLPSGIHPSPQSARRS